MSQASACRPAGGARDACSMGLQHPVVGEVGEQAVGVAGLHQVAAAARTRPGARRSSRSRDRRSSDERAHVEQVADADAVELGVAAERRERGERCRPRSGAWPGWSATPTTIEQALVARAAEVTVAERVPVARELQRLLAVEVRRARRRSARRRSRRPSAAGMLTSMPPISSTICWKCGKLARITHEIGTPTIDDTASASARRSLPPGLFTMYELILAPPGPSVSRGMSMMVADFSAGFTPITWTASARPGSSGDCAGSSDVRRCRATSAKNGCCGPPSFRALPSFVTWNHTAPCAGTGSPSASQAAVTAPASEQPAEQRARRTRA